MFPVLEYLFLSFDSESFNNFSKYTFNLLFSSCSSSGTPLLYAKVDMLYNIL